MCVQVTPTFMDGRFAWHGNFEAEASTETANRRVMAIAIAFDRRRSSIPAAYPGMNGKVCEGEATQIEACKRPSRLILSGCINGQRGEKKDADT